MTAKLRNIGDIKPFSYAFEPGIGGTMTDVGRTLGTHGIGLIIQIVQPGHFSSRKHRHLFQEELLIVKEGSGLLHHGDDRRAVKPGDAVCYLPGDPAAHCFENTGDTPLVIWAFGDRRSHEVCIYPEQGVAFVEGLASEVRLADLADSACTEDRRKT